MRKLFTLNRIQNQILSTLLVLLSTAVSVFAQCPTPPNNGSMAATGSGFNPATSLAPFFDYVVVGDGGTTTTGADETRALMYINTVNQFDIPATMSSLPIPTSFGNSVSYNSKGQQLIANFNNNRQGLVIVRDLEPSTTYYFQTVKVTRCGSTYSINNSIVPNHNLALATAAGLLETNTAKDVVFGTVGTTNIPLNSWTGITAPVAPSGYVVKMNTTNSFTPIADLTDPATLTGDTVWQDSGEQIMYVGNSNAPNIDITGLAADTQYYFKIYGYYNNYYQQTGHLAVASTTTSKPQANITFLGGTSNNMTTSIDSSFPLIATTNSSSSIIYQLVEAPFMTKLSGPSLTTGEAGTILVDVIAPGDVTYSANQERIVITVNKTTPTTVLNQLTVAPNSTTEIPFTTNSNGLITYSIVGAANGNSLSGNYNSSFGAGATQGTTTLIRAEVAASDYYEASTNEVYATVLKEESFFTTNSKLFSLSFGSVTTLVDFSTNSTNIGTNPFLIQEIGGQIWGVTNNGGTNGKGVVFRVDKDGSNFTKVTDFTASGSSAFPVSLQEINGKVYGATYEGGSLGKGQIWSANTDGTGYAIIHTFTSTGLQNPIGDLIDFNGKLYGAAETDTTNSRGGVFSIDYDGSNLTVEYLCDTTDTTPYYGLTQFDNLFWWTNSSNSLFGWNPITKTRSRTVTTQGSFNYPPMVIGNEMYVTNSSDNLEKITSSSSSTLVYNFANSSDIKSLEWTVSYDGTRIWGTAQDATGTKPTVYSILPNGTDIKLEYTGTANERAQGNILPAVEKLTPVFTFANQTVDHLSVTSLNALSNSTSPVTYSLIGDTTGSALSGNQFTAGNVGTVTIRASVAANDTFNAASTDVTFTIQKLDPTFVKSDLSLRLDQSPFTIVPEENNYVGGTITYQFVDPTNTNNLASSGFTTSSSISGNQLTLSGVGTETIRATLPASANFNAKTIDFQLDVLGGEADLSGFSDFEVELFQSNITLSIPSAPGVAVSYQLLTSNTGSSLSGTNSEILSVGNTLGTETLRVTVTEPNYNPTTKDITLTVGKATPQLTWATPTDIQVAVEPIDVVHLNAQANIPGSFVYTYTPPFGSPTVITAGVTALPTIGTETLTATFTPDDTANYKTGETVAVSINVVKVNLEITLDDKTIQVGNVEPSLTYTITNGGIIPGHTLFLPLAREAGNTPGNYAITVDNTVQSPQDDGESGSLICPNGLCIYGPAIFGGFSTQLSSYNISIVNGTFTINDKPQITADDITFTVPTNFEYDGTAKTHTATPDPALDPVLPIEDIEITYHGRNGTTYPSSATAPTNAGNYTVIASVAASNPNYGGSVSSEFSIAAVAIEITADAINKSYGDADPALTYQITSGSLVGSDVLTGDLERGAGEDVGNYAITQGTLDNTNYAITFVGEHLTIGTRAIIVTADAISKSEFTPDPTLTYQVTSGSLAFSDTFTGNIVRDAGEADGVYAITQGTLALNANYDVTFIDGQFTITDAQPGKSLHFNGSADNNYDYITVPDNNDLDFTTNYTFEAWINFDQLSVTTPGYGWRCLHAKSRYIDSYGLMILSSQKRMRFYHTGMGTGFTDYIWSTLTANEWNHVAVTLSPTEAIIYINGNEVSKSTFVASALTPNNEPLHIGSSRVVSSDPYPFDGAMDEVRLWNTTRTEAEINANKDIELAGDETGLVLNYQFNQGAANVDNTSITSVIDHSTNGYNGTFNQFALKGNESNFIADAGIVVIQDQTITFDVLADKTYGDASFDLTATASSGLDISYVSSDTSVATISGSTVTIVGVGSTTITASQAGDSNYNAAISVSQTLTVIDNRIKISPKVFLLGAALNPNAGEENLMRDNLRANDLIPSQSPYPDNAVLPSPVINATSGAKAVVDWVWVELIDSSNNTVAGKSAFLLRDGSIVSTDLVNPLAFDIAAGNYYVAVFHRNHLAIRSLSTLALSSAVTEVDLTQISNVFGGANSVTQLTNGNYAMYAGDINQNGQTQNEDVSNAANNLGASGYADTDADLNGQTQNSDIQSIIIPCIGKAQQFSRNVLP